VSRPTLRNTPDEERVMPSGHSALQVGVTDVGKVRVLTLVGALNATTYGPIRDTIVKAALDEPDSVVIDVTGLSVREDPAWAVFTSARWQIAEWPNVPLAMVCAHSQGRNGAQRNGITRYVPMYATLESALAELSADGLHRYRRRSRASLPSQRSSIRTCRELTTEWLTEWARTDFIHVVSRPGRGEQSGLGQLHHHGRQHRLGRRRPGKSLLNQTVIAHLSIGDDGDPRRVQRHDFRPIGRLRFDSCQTG
jgi:hypothetical protein